MTQDGLTISATLPDETAIETGSLPASALLEARSLWGAIAACLVCESHALFMAHLTLHVWVAGVPPFLLWCGMGGFLMLLSFLLHTVFLDQLKGQWKVQGVRGLRPSRPLCWLKAVLAAAMLAGFLAMACGFFPMPRPAPRAAVVIGSQLGLYLIGVAVYRSVRPGEMHFRGQHSPGRTRESVYRLVIAAAASNGLTALFFWLKVFPHCLLASSFGMCTLAMLMLIEPDARVKDGQP